MNMENKTNIEDMCWELRDALSILDNDLGEYWSSLARIYRNSVSNGIGSTEFIQSLEKEIEQEYQIFKKEYIVKEEILTKKILIHELDNHR